MKHWTDPTAGLTPTAHLESASELHNANGALRDRIGLLTKAIELRHGERSNSQMGLARALARDAGSGGLGGQDQITSIGPLYRSAQYYPLTIDYYLLGYLYSTHGILQTMVDEPVLDAFRSDDGPGFELISQEAATDKRASSASRERQLGIDRIGGGVGGSVGDGGLQELEAFAEETGAWEALKYMLMWGGLYGGSGLVVNAGQDPQKPLEANDVKRGRLEFYDADRWEFSGAYRSAKTFAFYGNDLDASRVITYGGKRAPRLQRVLLGGWGMSEMQRANEDFNVYLRGRNDLYNTIQRSNIDVYAIEGYADTLAMPGGEQTLRARLQATNAILNFSRALIIDKEDDYKVVAKSFNGLADVMQQIRIGIQSATRIPSVKLWGSAAAQGLSSQGAETENDVYNALVISRVRTPARPIIRKMLRLMMIAVYGKEYDVSFKFKSLRSLSAKEEEEIKTSKTTRFLSLFTAKVLRSDELGKILAQEDLVPIQTAAERGELEAFAPEAGGDIFAEEGKGGDDGKGSDEGDGEGSGGDEPPARKSGGDGDDEGAGD